MKYKIGELVVVTTGNPGIGHGLLGCVRQFYARVWKVSPDRVVVRMLHPDPLSKWATFNAGTLRRCQYEAVEPSDVRFV